MSKIAGILKNAAATTAKGAAITLTSTVVSCALACYIEIGAHRLVYHYFPHKYANVEHANGLTQEQLDAVRIYRQQPIQPISLPTSRETNTPMTMATPTPDVRPARPQEKFLDQIPTTSFGSNVREEKKSVFQWREKEFALGSSDLMAAAMTC